MTKPKKTPLTNAEKCRRRRLKLAETDPERFQREKEENKERARKNRQKEKTPEQLKQHREMALERQKRYLAKKAAEEAAHDVTATLTPRRTRLDADKEARKREANYLAVRKHRSLQSAQKQRRVREKRMAYYYRKKAEKEATHMEQQLNNKKGTQADLTDSIRVPLPRP